MEKFVVCDVCGGFGFRPKAFYDTTKELHASSCTHEVCPDCKGTGMKPSVDSTVQKPPEQIQKLID